MKCHFSISVNELYLLLSFLERGSFCWIANKQNDRHEYIAARHCICKSVVIPYESFSAPTNCYHEKTLKRLLCNTFSFAYCAPKSRKEMNNCSWKTLHCCLTDEQVLGLWLLTFFRKQMFRNHPIRMNLVATNVFKPTEQLAKVFVVKRRFFD